MVAAVVSTSEAVESVRWPKANATLGICRVSRAGIESHSYSPSVQYSFEVDGQAYQGNSYNFAATNYSRSTVEKMIGDLLSNRDSFMIRYDPTDPSKNVVIPGVKTVHYIRALVGIAIVGICVFLSYSFSQQF